MVAGIVRVFGRIKVYGRVKSDFGVGESFNGGFITETSFGYFVEFGVYCARVVFDGSRDNNSTLYCIW